MRGATTMVHTIKTPTTHLFNLPTKASYIPASAPQVSLKIPLCIAALAMTDGGNDEHGVTDIL
eukprot:scaffold509545_cov26-Prasinocladus_malaysianus.AAC.1